MPRTTPHVSSEHLASLMCAVSGGDHTAFAELYDAVSPLVYGIVLRVVRDPAQSEEVAQEVLVEVWRTAARFDPARGAVKAWVATMAHRRAVDLVRSSQASRNRSDGYGRRMAAATPFDTVVEEVEATADQEAVRCALETLTPPRESPSSWPTTGGSPRLGQAVFTATGLPAISDEETYELWLIDDDGPAPAGQFTPTMRAPSRSWSTAPFPQG